MIELGILFGAKTLAWFDLWSIEHILSGVSIGYFVSRLNASIFVKEIGAITKTPSLRYFDLVGVGFFAYTWETIEHYLETGLAGQHVAYWFQGVEFWGNRLIADPLLLVLGYFIACYSPRVVLPVRLLSLLWLILHVFVFPHSMYLQDILHL